MSSLAPPVSAPSSVAPPENRRRARNGVEFMASLGNVPLHRVIFDPPPGTVNGTYYDTIDGRVEGRLVELVNGTLVEKTAGINESRIASNLIVELGTYVRRGKVGFVAGEAGTIRMVGGNRRMPDVAVYLRSDYPGGERPTEKVPQLPPRLGVEVLSEGNTPEEIDIKLREFFASGCRLAYVIDPATRTARRYASADAFTQIPADGTLDGGDVLPGFAVKLAALFEE